MYTKAEKNYCDLVISNVENIAENNDESTLKLKNQLDIAYKKWVHCTKFYSYDFYHTPLRKGPVAKLYRKEIIDENKIRFPEEVFQEDEAFYWFFMPFVNNLFYINESLYFRLIHSGSVMYNLKVLKKGVYDRVQVIKQIKQFLKKKDLYNLYEENFINYVKNCIYNIEDREIRDKFFLKTLAVMPEFLLYCREEARLLKQIFSNRKKKIAFWGASLFLEKFLRTFDIKAENIVGIIDKNPDRAGEKIWGYEIFPPEKLAELGVEVVIFTVKNNSGKIYSIVSDYLKEKFSSVELAKNPFKDLSLNRRPTNIPHYKLRDISIHLVEHCNLNCKRCAHFSPLAEKIFRDTESFERDLKRIAELFGTKGLSELFLLGGEPLLHPNLIDFLRISRSCFPYTRITLLTNGVTLPEQKEDFWQACNKYNIAIEVTKYPIKLDFEKMEELSAKYDIEFQFFGSSGTVIKTSDLYPMDINGRQDIVSNFKNCTMANECFCLEYGKLYTCATIAYIHHFNKFFGYNLSVTDKDYVDIYKAKSAKEILKALAIPAPFCRFCDVNNRIYKEEEWGISKKDIREWTL